MATELISCKDQPEITRYKRINGLLLEAYDMKTGYNGGAKDKYGNICFNKDRVSYRTVVEDFLRTDVLEYVKRRDVRFSGTVHGVGSFFAGVSVSSNEADLLFVVDIEGALEDCKELPGYAKYRLSGSSLEKWKDCTTSDGYLMSRKLATLFYHYVEEALESKLRNNLTVSGTDITPEVCLTGIGTIASTLTVTYSTTAVIDIDLVVAVGCEGLPPLATAPWLEGKSAWPNSETVAKIRASGFQLVSKAPYPLNEDEETTLWRISFSLAETMLLQDLDEHINAYGLCTKICFVLMKFYRLCFLAPLERNVTPVLKSYYLRLPLIHKLIFVSVRRIQALFYVFRISDVTPSLPVFQTCRTTLKVVMLFECQKYPDPAFWTSDKLAERFMSMYRQLYKMIEEERMPEFFMPAVNIMTSPVPIKSSLRHLLENPEEALEAWTKSTLKAFFLIL